MKKSLEKQCQEIYEKKGQGAVIEFCSKKGIEEEFCEACQSDSPQKEHFCLVCGSRTGNSHRFVIEALNNKLSMAKQITKQKEIINDLTKVLILAYSYIPATYHNKILKSGKTLKGRIWEEIAKGDEAGKI